VSYSQDISLRYPTIIGHAEFVRDRPKIIFINEKYLLLMLLKVIYDFYSLGIFKGIATVDF
jgi:hypothetical protein